MVYCLPSALPLLKGRPLNITTPTYIYIQLSIIISLLVSVLFWYVVLDISQEDA